jgi:hypothetical protein
MSSDLNSCEEQRSMFILFVQGKAQGATTGLGLSGIVHKRGSNKIAAESNGTVHYGGSWRLVQSK